MSVPLVTLPPVLPAFLVGHPLVSLSVAQAVLSMASEKAMGHTARIHISPDDVSPWIDSTRERGHRAGKVDGSELPALFQEAVRHMSGVGVVADDGT